MTEKDFLEKQGGTLHIRLLLYFNEYTTQEERENQKDDDILFFEMEGGRYSIRYIDLKQKADEETIQYIKDNDGELSQTLDGVVIKKSINNENNNNWSI